MRNSLWQILASSICSAQRLGLLLLLWTKTLGTAETVHITSQYNLQNLWCNCFYSLEVRCLETNHLVKTPIDKCFGNSLDCVQAVPTKGWGYSTVLITFYSSESILQWSMSQFTLVLSKWSGADTLNESQVIMNKQSYCEDLPSGVTEMHWNSSFWKGPVWFCWRSQV